MRAVLLLLLLPLTGCIYAESENPHLGLTRADARHAVAHMRGNRVPLARPVLILNGYHAWPRLAIDLKNALKHATSKNDYDFLVISYPFSFDIDTVTHEVARCVNERWPSADPNTTREIDVVGISMGGLIARNASLAPEQRFRHTDSTHTTPRLNIHHLYTLGTPHNGATLAAYITPDNAAHDMVPGSPFLTHLNAQPRTYTLTCYTQTRDIWTGATRASPPGTPVIWSSSTILFSHFSTMDNPLFIADIARRLRDEPPLLTPGPPPDIN